MEQDKTEVTEVKEHASRKREAAVKRQFAETWPGLLVGGAFVAIEAWFFISVLRSKLVAPLYVILIALALLLLGVAVVFLCRIFKKKVRFIIGTVLAVGASIGLLYGAKVINQVRQTIENMITPTTTAAPTEATLPYDESESVPPELSTEAPLVKVGVYVPADVPAQAIDEVLDGPFAILRETHRASTDQELEWLSQELGVSLQPGQNVTEYETHFEAVRAVLLGEAKAAILTEEDLQDALDFLAEMEIHDAPFRELTVLHGEKKETTPEETLPESSEDVTEEIEETSTEEETTTEETTPEPTTTAAPKPTTTAAPKPTEPVLTSPNNQKIFTVYIQGIDKNGLSYKSRCDVNILAVVNVNSKQCLLISTPRDYYVHMRDLGYRRDKLTHNGWYGVWSVMDTMKDLYNVQNDYYFRCDFSGFPRIIDAVGGVTVWVDKDITTKTGGYSFTKGSNYMNGAQALAYARERMAFGGGDAIRGRHQMDIIKAVLNKVMSGSALSNISGVLSSLSGAFETNMSYDLIASLVRALQTGGWNITSYTVGGSGSTEYSPMAGGNAYVMWPDYNMVNYAKSMIKRIYNGEWVTP